MPVMDVDKIVHAIRRSPSKHSLGILQCGASYVGRYARWASSVSHHVRRTTTVREQVTCLGCLAREAGCDE